MNFHKQSVHEGKNLEAHRKKWHECETCNGTSMKQQDLNSHKQPAHEGRDSVEFGKRINTETKNKPNIGFNKEGLKIETVCKTNTCIICNESLIHQSNPKNHEQTSHKGNNVMTNSLRKMI